MSLFIIIQLFIFVICGKGELLKEHCLSNGNTVNIFEIIYLYFEYNHYIFFYYYSALKEVNVVQTIVIILAHLILFAFQK